MTTTIYNIGDSAQAALQPLRGNGGPAFLDDGRCSGWVTVANTHLGPANYWSAAGSGVVVNNAPMASGTVCQLADAWNRGERIFNLDNNGWGVLIQAYSPFAVKPSPVKVPWQTRLNTAVRYSLSVSPGPKTISFAPLSGLERLPNVYRSK